MSKKKLTTADIFREHLHELGPQSKEHWDVINAILNCRTPALGGRLMLCDHCKTYHTLYHSCRNRHCPKCQAPAKQEWLEKRRTEILPVDYYHIVFTIPHELNDLFLRNKHTGYSLLFKAASKSLMKILTDWIGAKPGFMAALHTWGRQMLDHPHIHCIVPGGGLSDDGFEWIHAKKNYLCHYKSLMKVFRGILMDLIEKAFEKGQWEFH